MHARLQRIVDFFVASIIICIVHSHSLSLALSLTPHTHTHTHTHYTDPSRIIAPHIQYALLGSSITLQCETDLPDTSINWVRVQDGETMITPTAITIDPVSLEDGGTYTCRLRVNSEGTSASTTRDIELMIIGQSSVGGGGWAEGGKGRDC